MVLCPAGMQAACPQAGQHPSDRSDPTAGLGPAQGHKLGFSTYLALQPQQRARGCPALNKRKAAAAPILHLSGQPHASTPPLQPSG